MIKQYVDVFLAFIFHKANAFLLHPVKIQMLTEESSHVLVFQSNVRIIVSELILLCSVSYSCVYQMSETSLTGY